MNTNSPSHGDPYQSAAAPLIDMHAHPSLKATIFKRALTTSFAASKTFNPFSVRTDFDKLEKGGVDVLLSSVYAPEKGIIKDCFYLKILRYLMPFTYRRLFGEDYFNVVNKMIDRMEAQIEESPKVKLARSYQELEEILDRTATCQNGGGKERIRYTQDKVRQANGIVGIKSD